MTRRPMIHQTMTLINRKMALAVHQPSTTVAVVLGQGS